MQHACRARDGLPAVEPGRDPVAPAIFHEDGEYALEHEERLLDLVRMGGATLARRHLHDAEREAARRDRVRIMLARPASADETVLGAPPAFDLRVGERIPVTRYLGEAGDASVDQVLQRNSGTGRIYGVLDRLHK